jgi:prepilin-type N-terminal cleavage/methylation domain-containing protein
MKLRKVGPATSRGAFTLIELLVVIAIIAILASLILGVSGFVQEKAGRERANAEIHALSLALENYKLDNGTYPEGDGSETSTEILVDELLPKDTSQKSYFSEAPIRMLSSYRSKLSYADIRNAQNITFNDPFGNPYRYYFNAAAAAAGTATQNPVTNSQNNGPQFFDLWSYGKNPQKVKNNPEAWIKNW